MRDMNKSFQSKADAAPLLSKIQSSEQSESSSSSSIAQQKNQIDNNPIYHSNGALPARSFEPHSFWSSTSENSPSPNYLKYLREVSISTADKIKDITVQEYVKLKNDPKRGPILLRYGSVLGCLFLIPLLTLDMIGKLFTFSPLQVLVNIYAIMGCFLILSSEWARMSEKFGLRSMIHFYFGFLEYCVGLGGVQLFIASFVLSDPPFSILIIVKYIPALVIAICGICNIIWGFYAARKVNILLHKIRETEDERYKGDNITKIPNNEEMDTKSFTDKSILKRLSLMERKFNALDKHGDGFLTQEDLKEGIDELHLNINPIELHIIFQNLDVNKDGRISKDEFERWWILNKSELFL